MTDLNETGCRDGLASLVGIRKALTARLSDAERRFGEAESDLNACRKLLGFADQQRDELHARLRALQDINEREPK